MLYLNKDEVSRTAIIALCYLEMVLLNYLYRCNNDNEKPITSYETSINSFVKEEQWLRKFMTLTKIKSLTKSSFTKGQTRY